MGELPIPERSGPPSKITGLALINICALALCALSVGTHTLLVTVLCWLGTVVLAVTLTIRLAYVQSRTHTLHILNPKAVFLSYGVIFFSTMICAIHFLILLIF